MPIYLASEVMSSFNSALNKLTGFERRQYAAELCEQFFENSPRIMERRLNVSREMVELGLNERRTGIRCLDAYEQRGSKKKEEIHQDLEADIKDIVDKESQIDPQFKTQRCYVKVSAPYIYKELILKKAYELKDFCQRTINNILNRLGYTLKKVLKTKPLKKIPQTDAIFDNVNKQHDLAKSNPRILRISIDVKAKVKVGNLSRKGYARTLKPPVAEDHDQKWSDVLVPFGISEINTDNCFMVFGNSKETSDFIVDALQWWWSERQFEDDQYDLLMIDLDNGKSVAGNTKRFLQRMVQFAQKTGIPIQLVYYPPYHSKYNAIERVWAALEQYWNGLILDTVDNTLTIARQMTWKGINPMVHFLDKVYEKGIKVDSEDFKELEHFIVRNPDLYKWDIRINNFHDG